MIRATTFCCALLALGACDDNPPATTGQPADVPAASAAPTATAETTAEKGSIASLRAKAEGVLTALKKGDAKAAGEYCLGKHKEGLTKYLQEHLDKEGGSRNRAFKTWDGTLGEIRIDDKRARVQFNTEGDELHVLAFRQVEGAWSLDDVPSTSKDQFAKWGEVAKE